MIYIQVNEDGFPWHDTCLHVYEECIEGEVDYGLVDERTFGRTRFRPEDVFVGDIPYTSRFIREVLRRDFEMLECYPAELRPFLGRDIFPLSLDELRMRTKPLFVKPMEPKLFAGGVQTFEEVEPHLPPGYDTSLATCFGAEPVDIRAEYRFFVSRGEIVGIQHADGDFRRFPEVGEIKEWIASFRAQPVAFC
ncbi:MAG: ATP-grasp domain-containing protein, partial [Myxococcota bacterium]